MHRAIAVAILALSIAACKTAYQGSYTICNDVANGNNVALDCPGNTANVVVENDIKGM